MLVKKLKPPAWEMAVSLLVAQVEQKAQKLERKWPNSKVQAKPSKEHVVRGRRR